MTRPVNGSRFPEKASNEDLGERRRAIVETTIDLLGEDERLVRHDRFRRDGQIKGIGICQDRRPDKSIPVAVLNFALPGLRLYGRVSGKLEVCGTGGQTNRERQDAQQRDCKAPQP